jgi:hypothetical protein
MKILIQLALLVGLACTFGQCASLKSTPFSSLKRYSVSGIIQLPYAEITEPFRAWYDSEQFASRIDYYDGMVSTIQLAPTTSTSFGTAIKVVPVTNEVQTNVKKCFWMNGTQNASVTLQNVIPDTTSFSVKIYLILIKRTRNLSFILL